MPRKKLPKLKSVDPAVAAFKAKLAEMTDGRLERERLALRTKASDSWEMAAWREESAKRSPTWR